MNGFLLCSSSYVHLFPYSPLLRQFYYITTELQMVLTEQKIVSKRKKTKSNRNWVFSMNERLTVIYAMLIERGLISGVQEPTNPIESLSKWNRHRRLLLHQYANEELKPNRKIYIYIHSNRYFTVDKFYAKKMT